jgi:hypothetical protein
MGKAVLPNLAVLATYATVAVGAAWAGSQTQQGLQRRRSNALSKEESTVYMW